MISELAGEWWSHTKSIALVIDSFLVFLPQRICLVILLHYMSTIMTTGFRWRLVIPNLSFFNLHD